MPTFFNENSQAVKQKNDQKKEMDTVRNDIQNLQQAVKMLADEGAKEIDQLAQLIIETRDRNESLSKDLGNLTVTVYKLSILVRITTFVAVGASLGLIASIIL